MTCIASTPLPLVPGTGAGLRCPGRRVRSLPRAASAESRESRPERQQRRTGGPVDLMEYQAKELFAKHGVATTLGVVV